MKSNENKIRLEFVGFTIPANKFVKGVNAFFDIIDEVTNSVTGKKKEIEWKVTVESGSASIIAIAESINGSPETIPKTIEIIERGIKTIENRAQRPEHFSDTSLRKIHDLASIVDEKEPELYKVNIWIKQKPQAISLSSAANVNKIMGIKYYDLGSVEGKLQVISERKGLRFVVYDDLHDKAIRCYFDDDIINDVINAFSKRVSVYGLITYKAHGEPYSVKVEKFRVFKDKDDLPTINDVLGIMKE